MIFDSLDQKSCVHAAIEAPFALHPDNAALHGEIHARPFPLASAPLRASFFAVLSDAPARAAARRHFETLCESRGGLQIESGAAFCCADFGEFHARFERHTEFWTLALFWCGDFDSPFENVALDFLPREWLSQIPGEVVASAHIALQASGKPELSRDELREFFDGHRLIASQVVDGDATLWTALRQHGDGFSRFYLKDKSLSPCRAGRLVQRVFELETYRSLALLGLPLARELGPKLHQMEALHGAAVCDLENVADLEAERALLSRLTHLAASVEKVRACSSSRFAATRAYAEIVAQRLAELREEEILGLQTVGEFLDRRMPLALRACDSVNDVAEGLAKRLDRTADLLRTRIDLTLEAQNQQLLASVEERAGLQIRLQETVEGLSVVAISYYLLQLVKYGWTTFESFGLSVPHAISGTVSLPLAVLIAWTITQRAKRHVHAGKKENRG